MDTRITMKGSDGIRRAIARLYLYACVSLLVGFVIPLIVEPLRVAASSILNALVATELALPLGTLAYGFIIATLFTFAWNFLLGAGLQILAGLFGPEITKIILFGRAALIAFIYGGTTESIAHALNYNTLSYAGLAVVVLTEFLAYSIATHGGVNVGKVLMASVDGTLTQRIVNVLKGPQLSAYRKMKNEVKKELRASLNLCPIIAILLIFAAALEIWLVLG
jgi:hypothetical protein